MILMDAGPMIALFWTHDPNHEICRRELHRFAMRVHTTWAPVAEAMHFLGKRGGWRLQGSLSRQILDGRIVIASLDEPSVQRAFELMEKYRDVPMDLADATLVALAEKLDCKTVFTLDGDFRIYRFRNRQSFQIIPKDQ